MSHAGVGTAWNKGIVPKRHETLSYMWHVPHFVKHFRAQKKAAFSDGLLVYGRGERIRTSDLTVPNRALYQAEPRPDKLKY